MARQMPQSGFQAFILCGPGVSLNTFTSNPEEFPKALIPIANRPMVWYPLDWCYRMGLASTLKGLSCEHSLIESRHHTHHASSQSTGARSCTVAKPASHLSAVTVAKRYLANTPNLYNRDGRASSSVRGASMHRVRLFPSALRPRMRAAR